MLDIFDMMICMNLDGDVFMKRMTCWRQTVTHKIAGNQRHQ